MRGKQQIFSDSRIQYSCTMLGSMSSPANCHWSLYVGNWIFMIWWIWLSLPEPQSLLLLWASPSLCGLCHHCTRCKMRINSSSKQKSRALQMTRAVLHRNMPLDVLSISTKNITNHRIIQVGEDLHGYQVQPLTWQDQVCRETMSLSITSTHLCRCLQSWIMNVLWRQRKEKTRQVSFREILQNEQERENTTPGQVHLQTPRQQGRS